jgi:competence protein ComEA
MEYRRRIIWQWTFTAAMITIAAGCIILIGAANRQPPPLEVTPPVNMPSEGSVYTGGNVSDPAYYPGTATENPQLVNINRAEAWLLEALPGIGEVKARAIIDYRTAYGRFTTVTAITEVPGISRAVYENIKPYITVADE